MPKMELRYTAVIAPAGAGRYIVTFPALPNLAVEGTTLEQARARAVDRLRDELEFRRGAGLALPPRWVRPRTVQPPAVEEVTVALDLA